MDRNCSTSLICMDQTMVHSLVSDILTLGLKYRKCNYNWFHADFMDGHFVPRLGIPPELIQHLRKAYGPNIIIDSHMMVDDPFTYADVICPYSDYYMFHVEAVKDPMRTIQKVRKNWPNVKVGLYFNLSTDILSYKYILTEVDCIGLMGISPGVLGTKSYPSIILNKLRNYFDNKNEIEYSGLYQIPSEVFIDGSVNFNTIPEYFRRGVTTVICGSSSIMNKLDQTTIEKNIEKIENLI